MIRPAATLAAVALVLLGGCAELAYYAQSVNGQLSLLRARRPLPQVEADPATPPALRERLVLARELRDFASRELGLPDNGSYRSYADLKRPYAVWNVFAAPEFSLTPRRWCYPVAGCAGYRGYFSEAAAQREASALSAQGDDVYLGGVPAYSTLGWFDDPLLNTFIRYPEYELARMIFHELAHQVVYVKGDTAFNESFAVAVELEGVRRWIARSGDAALASDFERAQARRAEVEALVARHGAALEKLYASGLPPADMRAAKAARYAAFSADYANLKSAWGGYAGYDRFFASPNNALLAAVQLYTARVPQFSALLAQHGGDLPAFFADVRALARLDKAARDARLDAFSPRAQDAPR